MKIYLAVVALSAVLLNQAGLAAEETQGERGSLESLKAKCAELTSNQQIKPFKIQITCRESGFNWKPGKSSKVPTEGHREVGAAIRMKNVEVPYQGQTVRVEPTETACPTLEKWSYVIAAVDVQVSCDELDKITNVSDFCLPVLEERRAAEPGIVQEEATGQTMNLCSTGSASIF